MRPTPPNNGSLSLCRLIPSPPSQSPPPLPSPPSPPPPPPSPPPPPEIEPQNHKARTRHRVQDKSQTLTQQRGAVSGNPSFLPWSSPGTVVSSLCGHRVGQVNRSLILIPRPGRCRRAVLFPQAERAVEVVRGAAHSFVNFVVLRSLCSPDPGDPHSTLLDHKPVGLFPRKSLPVFSRSILVSRWLKRRKRTNQMNASSAICRYDRNEMKDTSSLVRRCHGPERQATHSTTRTTSHNYMIRTCSQL